MCIAVIPKMPTEAVVKQYEELVGTIQALIDVKRQTDRLENEIKSFDAPPPQTPVTSSSSSSAAAAAARRRSVAPSESSTKKRSNSPAAALPEKRQRL